MKVMSGWIVAVFFAAVAVGMFMLKSNEPLPEPVGPPSELVAAEKERDSLKRQLAAMQAQLDQQAAEQKALEDEISGLRKQAALAKVSKVDSFDDPFGDDEGGETAGKEESAGKAFFSALKKMYDDPKMKDMMRAQQQMGVERMYAALFAKLNLDDARLAQLKDVLIDGQVEMSQLGMSLMGKLSDDERQRITDEIAVKKEQMEADIEAILGDEYPAYTDYRETMSARQSVMQFSQQVANTGNALNETQSDQLIDIIHQSNKAAFGEDYNFENPAKNMKLMESDESLEAFMEQVDVATEESRRGVSEVLSPSQADAFVKFQENQIQMMKMGMQMGRQMYTDGDKEE
jgi:hypothetical protein